MVTWYWTADNLIWQVSIDHNMMSYIQKVHRKPRLHVSVNLLAELRQPDGPPSRAPYSYREEKETHELIFSWLSWPAALLVGAYAQRRRPQRSRATWRPYSKYLVDRDIQPWFTMYFFDIEHPCYDQLTFRQNVRLSVLYHDLDWRWSQFLSLTSGNEAWCDAYNFLQKWY